MVIGGRRASVVVIGGGITGLVAGYELARLGFPVTVLEKDEAVGGITGSFEVNGSRVGKFYHHFFRSDEHLIRLAGEIGLGNQLHYAPTKTSTLYRQGFFQIIVSAGCVAIQAFGFG